MQLSSDGVAWSTVGSSFTRADNHVCSDSVCYTERTVPAGQAGLKSRYIRFLVTYTRFVRSSVRLLEF